MRLIRALLVGVLVAGFTSSTYAASIQFVDSYTPAGSISFDDGGHRHSFTHNILTDVVVDGGFESVGYDAATDTLSSAFLLMSFTDGNQGNDIVRVYFDAIQQGTTQLISGDSLALTVNVSLLLDGFLAVQLVKNADPGDFRFNGSVLTILGTRGSTEPPAGGEIGSGGDDNSTGIPEPGMLALFGAGLLGAAGQRRLRGRSVR